MAKPTKAIIYNYAGSFLDTGFFYFENYSIHYNFELVYQTKQKINQHFF